jgi:hypothetical protein
MPKYEVVATVEYRFELEADSQDLAENLGTDFENYRWELDVIDTVATEIKES